MFGSNPLAAPSAALGQPSLAEVFLALTGHPADDQPVGGDIVVVFAISAALIAVFGPLTTLVYCRKA